MFISIALYINHYSQSHRALQKLLKTFIYKIKHMVHNQT